MGTILTGKQFLALLLVFVCLSGCYSSPPTQLAQPSSPPSSPTSPPTLTPPSTATANPTATATVTITPVPTENPADYINAIYWHTDLQAPMILYHRFLPEQATESSRTKMTLADFRAQIQDLYDAGYSLVPIEKWLAGDINLPVGRRPLILSMDDLFFADQIYLEADGTPSLRSGLGILWEFSQKHPDFGYSAALFYNLGDKYYGNIKTSDWFLVGNGWQDALAKAIIWCIEHDAIPYNHTYMHSFLDQLDAPAIFDDLQRNDIEMRKILTKAGREDLIPRLDNLIGLPYGVWPATKGLQAFMLGYHNPENKPIKAVFEAGYFFEKKYVLAPFETGYDRFHIPRITTNTHKSIEFLVQYHYLFPETLSCRLGPFKSGEKESFQAIVKQIDIELKFGNCVEGTYRVNDMILKVEGGRVEKVWDFGENNPYYVH